MHRFHFISGLPRSGSTLLAAILRQNPQFHAGMSGPVSSLMDALLGEMSARSEYAVFIEDAHRRRVLGGLLKNYYADVPERVVFDTSRVWCARMGMLQSLCPQSRVIACVRHMPWVIDSVERVIQRNTFQPSSIFNYTLGGTVYSRAEGVANGDGLVGYSYNALKQAFFGEHAGNLMLLQYETLVGNPRAAMEAVYDFIGEPAFEHDFDCIDYDVAEFDSRTGTPGLHTVRPQVAAVERETLLPPDLFQRFENDDFWRNPALNRRGALVV